MARGHLLATRGPLKTLLLGRRAWQFLQGGIEHRLVQVAIL